MVEPVTFTPRVLSEYELGRIFSAIENVSLTGKPIAEVVARAADRNDLESDLNDCLKLSGKSEGVSFWMMPSGSKWRFGFYRDKWTQRAILFLEHTELSPTDRAWISGLLYGYRSDAIQKFIDEHPEK